MHKVEPSSRNATDRPVLPWRIVAGAFLHLALPAYLLVGLACCAVGLLGRLTSAELASRVFPYSSRFVVAYLLLGLTATATAVVLDPLLRRSRRMRVKHNPDVAQKQSRHYLAIALSEGRSRLDPDAVSMLDAIALICWHHEEPAFQSISADLAEVVRTSVAALETAMPDRRKDLAAVTTATLARVTISLRDLQEQRGRLDEGDLRTIARYIDSRYPRSDCAGDSGAGGVDG